MISLTRNGPITKFRDEPKRKTPSPPGGGFAPGKVPLDYLNKKGFSEG